MEEVIVTLLVLNFLVSLGGLGIAVWAVLGIKGVSILVNGRLSELLNAREAKGKKKAEDAQAAKEK